MSIALEDFALGGDPDAIRMSATGWAQRGASLAAAAVELNVSAALDDFWGDESISHAERAADLVRDLDQSAEAWHVAARALTGYADVLQACQQRLAVLRADALAAVSAGLDPWSLSAQPNALLGGPDGVRTAMIRTARVRTAMVRTAMVRGEHGQAVIECVRLLARATSLLPHQSRAVGSLGESIVRAGKSVPAVPYLRPALVDLTARLRAAAATSALALASQDGPADFWSDVADLLGWATLGVTAMGGGGAGGLAAVGGEVIAGGAAAAVAGPLAIGTGVAVALLGGALLVTAAIKGESPGETWDDLTTKEVAGSPEIDPNGLHQIAAENRAGLPPDVLAEVDEVIARAKINKRQFPGHDGKVWEDRLGQLPPPPHPGYYEEWTAARVGSSRGEDRVIIAGDRANPDAIYYWDHTSAAPTYVGP